MKGPLATTTYAPNALSRVLGLRLPWVSLGDYPTPVESLDRITTPRGVPRVYIKRDDLSSSTYGGNKVRLLEPALGAAQARGATSVATAGTYGSNQVLALGLHAKRVGLSAHAYLVPQPRHPDAIENAVRIAATCETVTLLGLPDGPSPESVREAFSAFRRVSSHELIDPAGVSVTGVLGHVAGALELAEQIARGDAPEPGVVVVGLGSGCTCAGFLLGFWIANQRGLGFSVRRPELVGVRVAPRPLASRGHVIELAMRTGRFLKSEGWIRRAPGWRELASKFTVDGKELGRGFGYSTEAGDRTCREFRAADLPILDGIYGGKIATAALRHASDEHRGPVLFWATKSSAALPRIDRESIVERLPARLRAWVEG